MSLKNALLSKEEHFVERTTEQDNDDRNNATCEAYLGLYIKRASYEHHIKTLEGFLFNFRDLLTIVPNDAIFENGRGKIFRSSCISRKKGIQCEKVKAIAMTLKVIHI
jgi:hypothetical protein